MQSVVGWKGHDLGLFPWWHEGIILGGLGGLSKYIENPISHVAMVVIPVINLLTASP